MMSVLLVDDEPLALERLKVAFREIPETRVVGVAADGEEASRKLGALSPDLLVLDIQMPGASGLEVAAKVSGEQRPEVIFITAFQHYGPEAFDVEAADYLLKPVRFDRLKVAVDRARRRRRARLMMDGEMADEPTAPTAPVEAGAYDAELWAPTTRGLVRVRVDQLIRIEAAGDYALLHTEGRSYMLRTTMNALQERLDPRIMARVHRSAFVRLEAVKRVQRIGKGLIALELEDGAIAPVGPNYTAAVLKALNSPAAGAAKSA